MMERNYRILLLILAGWICAGTAIELWLGDHTESALQLVPFALCGLGLAALALALYRPGRATLIGLRVMMALLLAGSALGIFEHITSNAAFEIEIRPGAAFGDVWFEALRGASPPLAPGILALAAVLALAATYRHPALGRPASSTNRRSIVQ